MTTSIHPEDVLWLVEHSSVISPPPFVLEIKRANSEVLQVLMRLDRPWAKSVWDKPDRLSADELLQQLNGMPGRTFVREPQNPAEGGNKTEKVTQKIINVNSIADMGELAIKLLAQETKKTDNPVQGVIAHGPSIAPYIKASRWVGKFNEEKPEQAVNFTAQESPQVQEARALTEALREAAEAEAPIPEAGKKRLRE